MEISSDSDSDDCPLYSNAVNNIAKKRKVIDSKLNQYEKVLDLVHNSDEIDSKYRHLLDDSLSVEDCIVNVSKSSDSSGSDSEDSLSLSELLLRYQNERRAKKGLPKVKSITKPKPKSRKSQQATKKKTPSRPRPNRRRRQLESETSATILGTVVLDDDSGYSISNMAPIDFKSRSKTKPNSLNTPDISLSALVDLDSSADESVIESESSTITVEWKGKEKTTRKVFEIRRYQPFETVFEDLAKLENVPKSRVLLMHNFDTIRPSDTPASRSFKHYVALTGCISMVDIDFGKIVAISDDVEEKTNKDTLVVKLQQENRTFPLSILKHQKMSVLYEKCLEKLKCPQDKLKITFDGETVDPTETVADLDLEGGEIFHVYIKK